MFLPDFSCLAINDDPDQNEEIVNVSIFCLFPIYFLQTPLFKRGRRGRMIIGFITTYAISTCHQ